jgi:hypothetical protein
VPSILLLFDFKNVFAPPAAEYIFNNSRVFNQSKSIKERQENEENVDDVRIVGAVHGACVLQRKNATGETRR